jgi:hypothetical protein
MVPWLAALVALSAGCLVQPVTQKLDLDRYKITCRGPLDECLRDAATNACNGRPYFIVRALDEQNFRGRTDVRLAEHTSEALIKCGPAHGWGDQAKTLMAESATSCAAAVEKPSAPAPRPTACTPGATQACIGPAACAGGQACLPDGTGYAPCDCGPAAPAATPPASK